MITYSEFIEKVKDFEGVRLNSYKCPSGVLSIGYGHTHGVVRNMCITPDIAERLLSVDMDIVVCQLDSLHLSSPYFNDCNMGLLYALVDFVFNVGFTKFKNSTLYKILKNIDLSKPLSSVDIERISIQLLRWTYSNGKVLKGLETRRKWEVSLLTMK